MMCQIRQVSHIRLFYILFISIAVGLYLYMYIITWDFSSQAYLRTTWRMINTTSTLSLEDQSHIASEEYPNVPYEYWIKVRDKTNRMFYKNNSCARFPNVLTLDVNNRFWQTVHMSNETIVQLYNAFYDIRRPDAKSVKILGMVNKLNNVFPGKHDYYCQLWFDNETEPVITKISQVFYIWYDYWHSHRDGMLGPYLISCPVPETHKDKVPKIVSFVEKQCDCANNMLSVIYNQPKEQKEFAVCVKGLDFFQVDLSARLVEWIEFLLFMGVDKIFFYKYDVHPNIEKVLNYYKSLGMIDVQVSSLPPGDPDVPIFKHLFIEFETSEKRLIELIPYNDCFYKNIYNYKYIVLLDIDEIIVPSEDKDWHEMMTRILEQIKPGNKYASYNARNVYFLDTMTPEGSSKHIPPYMHMLQHVYRARNFSSPGSYVKSFFDTNETISCHNHYPISTFTGAENSYDINIKDGFMHHYRHSCVMELKCDEYMKDPIRDTRLWSFKDDLIRNVNKAFDNLNFFYP